MPIVAQPTLKQEAAVRAQAAILLAADARFSRVVPEPFQVSTWAYLKGVFASPFENNPPSFDWRDRVTVAPAKFQGSCNSCSSFAASAAIEIATLVGGSAAIDVAAQHMHTCVVHRGESDTGDICSFGIEPRRLLQLLKNGGYAVSESDTAPFPPNACATVELFSQLSDFAAIPISAAKSRLTQGPLLTDLYIWDDFFDYTTNRAPAYSPNTSAGQPRLHSVCVIGYSTAGWIIKNSFGENWGDGTGFATIAKGTCGLLTDSPPPGLAQRPAYALQV